MQHLELEPEDDEMESLTRRGNKKNTNGVATAKPSSSTSSSCGMWDRQSRIAKGVFALLSGFLIGSLVTMVKFEETTATNAVSEATAKFHSSNFGGINNIAQPGGAKAHAAGLGIANDFDSMDDEEFFIPTSNLGHSVKSLGRENIINHYGHYIHDEHRSPYASHLYKQSQEFLQKEQEKYERKMKAVREEWGAWTDIEDDTLRPVPDFTKVSYKDMPNADFPPKAWQTDEEYVGKLIPEAKALVNRVTEGIYAEYGYPFKNKDGTELSEAEKNVIRKKFEIQTVQPGPEDKGFAFEPSKEGISWLSQTAMDGLLRKLLHGMITNDDFYVVLGGHSAAAGHGNNFAQNKIISFHTLMEPVFDKLGMRLISRNMGMGGVGTLQKSLAGKMIYGETDIMLWDSGMTENGVTVDFYNKQAVLAGERMPVLLTAKPFEIAKETKGKAWIGDVYINTKILPVTVDEVQVNELPYAVRFMNNKEPRLNDNEKFNSICWEGRSDFTPIKTQAAHPGSQVGWHPGFRHHQYEGRVLALTVLEGLRKALDLWEEAIEKDGFPLAESYWHVGDVYEDVREEMRTHVNTEKEDGSARSACETFIPHLPRICRVAMQGYGMWTPRLHSNFLDIVHPAPNGYKPTYQEKMQYEGFDLLPLSQAIPDGDIDVHAIAIATNTPPVEIDHQWIEEHTKNSTDSSLPTRRWLREATQAAWTQGMEHLWENRNKKDADSTTTQLANGKTTTKSTDKNVAETSRELQEAAADENAVIPGRGWTMDGWSLTEGYCDGSSMSTCMRGAQNICLLYGHNDNHIGLLGSALSGWLVFTVPKVKEGIILARLEWWTKTQPSVTVGWTEVNDGKTLDTTPYDGGIRQLTAPTPEQLVQRDIDSRTRQLKKPTPDQLVPKDFEMDIAINGVITKTMKRDEWLKYIPEPSKNCAVWPLLNDEEMAKRENFDGEAMDVAIRFRSKQNTNTGYVMSHVYYA